MFQPQELQDHEKLPFAGAAAQKAIPSRRAERRTIPGGLSHPGLLFRVPAERAVLTVLHLDRDLELLANHIGTPILTRWSGAALQ